MRVVITGGPSSEPIDQVRMITNRSTGELAVKLARRVAASGHEVDLLLGQGSIFRSQPAKYFFSNEDLYRLLSEVAERLSAATGRTIRYVNVAPEDAKRAQLAAGVPPYMADALAELFAERRNGGGNKVWPVLQDVFGLRPTPFAEFAARNAAIFRGEAPAPKL